MDTKYMELALAEARKSYDNGEVPIGAILVIGGEIVGSGGNIQTSRDNWTDHAESTLIRTHGSAIKKASKNSLDIELFPTLEPCLMCFGTSVHNRVNRIIYGSPDPAAGATDIVAPTEWYGNRWPEKSTAANIKSKTTRSNVTDALERIIRELKTHKQTPPNGLALFSGNVSEKQGSQNIELWTFEPPKPLNIRLYRCDQTFVIESLKQMLEVEELYGLLVIDRQTATIGLLEGKRIKTLQKFTSGVPGKNQSRRTERRTFWPYNRRTSKRIL